MQKERRKIISKSTNIYSKITRKSKLYSRVISLKKDRFMPPNSSDIRHKPQAWKITLILIIGLIAYSSGAIFVRLAITADNSGGLGFSLFLAASRLALASILLMPAWRGFFKMGYSKQAISYSLMTGICLAGYFATWFTSLSYTSITASTTLVNTHPIWVVIFAWIWCKDKPKRLTLWGVSMAFVGSSIIGLVGEIDPISHDSAFLGNLLAVLGGLAISAYILLGQKAQCSGLKLRHHIVLANLVSALVLLPLPFLFKASYVDHSTTTYLCILMMTLITQLLGHTCINWSMRWVKSTPLSLVILGEPIVASIFGYLTFHEIPGLSILAGAVLLVVGIAITVLGSSEAPIHLAPDTSMSNH